MPRYGNHAVWKGMAAGLVAGFVASWTMNQFQALLSKIAESGEQQSQSQQQESQPKPEREPATVKAAEKLSRSLLHRELRDDQKQIADSIVHYGYGTAWGGIYGVLAEVKPETSKALGLPFGTALWLAGDEIAVSALGLSGNPLEYPVSSHLQALAAHCIYGVTTDLVRRAMRKALERA
jgi:uncharacterized membrane protein YagU involved in acid resistance